MELAGLAIAVLSLVVPFSQGLTTSIGNPVVGLIGLVVVLVGLLMHIARV